MQNWRKRSAMWVAAVIASGGLLAAAATSPAGAEVIYRWTADSGEIAFTDDIDRIPARYRKHARQESERGLANYSRYTHSAASLDDHRAALAERLEYLRSFNGGGEAHTGATRLAAASTSGALHETVIQLDDRTTVRVPHQATEEAGPIIVEEVRVKRDGSLFTQHNTIVRQGDKILMVVRPAQPHQAGPNDYIDESDLLDR